MLGSSDDRSDDERRLPRERNADVFQADDTGPAVFPPTASLALRRRSATSKFGTRSTPTSSARSRSSEPPCRICDIKEEAASCKFRLRGARSPIRILAFNHATKWAIEGFVESVAQEVAPFNIEFTIVEPGPAKTGFGAGLVRARSMAVYEDTPVGEMRRAFAAGTFKVKGDAVKMAEAMIDSVDRSPAPKRLALGSTAYNSIRADILPDAPVQVQVRLSAMFRSMRRKMLLN